MADCMRGQTCENGIYQSRSKWGPAAFHENRNVYIVNGSVVLVNDTQKMRFAYDFYFEVNDLGERIGDIPTDLKL